MIEQVCERVFESCRGFGVGHLVWAPVPHLEEVPRILDVERARSEDHYATKFSIVQLGADHFRERRKLPVKALALGDTEELLISKAKKRPCVILSARNTEFSDTPLVTELRRRRHLQDLSMVLAPVYGTAVDDLDAGFPPVMTARIRAFLYNQFFYLPKTCPKTRISIAKEGVVRLDRLFAATPTRGLHPMDIRLAEEPMLLLLAVVRERFGGVEDENLKLVRELLVDELPAEARPSSS
jgi:hypothetical protein